MAFIVTKRGTAGPPRGPPRPQERNQSLGKLPKAVLRLLYGCALADLAPRLGHAKDQVKEPKSGVKLEARAAIHRYLGAMLQLTKTQH